MVVELLCTLMLLHESREVWTYQEEHEMEKVQQYSASKGRELQEGQVNCSNDAHLHCLDIDLLVLEEGWGRE